ncbi:MAG: N-acetylglucosamine kinase [Acidobacteriota bacterium]
MQKQATSPSERATSDLVVGVDGGGTHTRARLANLRGEMLGNGEAGPSNPNAIGYAAAQAELLAAIEGAFQDARMERQNLAAACFGIGGVHRTEERERLGAWARETIAPSVLVVNDGEIVLTAGTPENWGVALIAGTGSFAWGKARDGRTARAGGWGYLIGDEGSGFDLAREALRAAAQSADGRRAPTRLLDAFLQYWDLGQPMELIPRIYRTGMKPGDIAALAPLVMRVAKEGDSTAQALLKRAAALLADTVMAVARALSFGVDAVPVALSGGLLLEADLLRAELTHDLTTRSDRFSPFTVVNEPVNGAVKAAIALVRG